jgi:hypothetical protein
MIERGAHIVLFPDAAGEGSSALTRTAEIESQGREAEPECRLGGAEYHLVVQGSAVKRMGMANQRDVVRRGLRVPFQQRLQRPFRAGNEIALDFRVAPPRVS